MRQTNLNRTIKISLLSVIAFILMFLEFPLPIFPSFLQVDLSDIPALIGAFSLGPVAGILIELFKNVLHVMFKGSTTGLVGEFANFAVGSIFVFVAGIVYKQKKSKGTAIIGLVTGTIAMSIVASILNYTILLPLYSKAFKAPIDAFVQMGAVLNPNIKSVKDLVLMSILPFNLLKGIIVSIATFPIYKGVSPMIQNEDGLKSTKKGAFEN